MDAHNYWYTHLKKRGLKYPGKLSKKKIAELVYESLYSENRSFSKKQAEEFLEIEKQKKMNGHYLDVSIPEMACTYFIGSKLYEWVKIGYTTSVSSRIVSIQMGCPFDIELLAYIPSKNPAKTEKKLHRRFQHLRVRGEWFHLNEEVLEFIEQIKKQWNN